MATVNFPSVLPIAKASPVLPLVMEYVSASPSVSLAVIVPTSVPSAAPSATEKVAAVIVGAELVVSPELSEANPFHSTSKRLAPFDPSSIHMGP